MKIVDLYSFLSNAWRDGARGYAPFDREPELAFMRDLARSFGMSAEATREWFESEEGMRQRAVAEAYLRESSEIVKRVEDAFGTELPGTLVLAPSYGEFDGFARYDSGEHVVLLGIDFPDADLRYLRALTAHELSHVYRDHAPETWKHLGKPLKEISRREYLDAATAQEHLVSEGLATLFSQALFPDISPDVHHYYEESEWAWCVANDARIAEALEECLRGDEDVWSFYSPSRAGPGSPSRLQYYWAAQRLSVRLEGAPDRIKALVELHSLSTLIYTEFYPRKG